MKIHHLNCGTMRPANATLVGDGATAGGFFRRGRLVCHVLAVETRSGVLLVDSGFGTADVTHPVARLGRAFLVLTQPALAAAETAVAQLTALGIGAGDVRGIAVTHLDADHAGGLSDFPGAAIHVSAIEHAAAVERATANERRRYHPVQWSHNPQWALYDAGGERWLGFQNVRALPGSDDEILCVPLAGHSRGHTGIAIRSGDGWLLHAGDAHFYHGELETPRRCPLGLRVFQTLMQVDGEARHANQARLAALRAGHPEVRIVCAHDPVDLQKS